MMVVRLMIILTWIYSAVSGLEVGSQIVRLLVAWLCLGVSKDRFYFCTDGLLLCWVRNAPSRPLPARLYLIFWDALSAPPGCLVSLVYCRAWGGGTFVNKTVTWTGSQAGQANPGVTGDGSPEPDPAIRVN